MEMKITLDEGADMVAITTLLLGIRGVRRVVRPWARTIEAGRIVAFDGQLYRLRQACVADAVDEVETR